MVRDTDRSRSYAPRRDRSEPEKPERRIATIINVVDTHYGGDVSRIVLDGIARIPGETLPEQVDYLRSRADGLRRLLLYEPHGNPAMCVNLVVPPCDPRAEAGYITMEAMGYPPFSGSNTVCTVTALLESGRWSMRKGTRRMCLESPEGLVDVLAECRDRRVVSVTCEGQPAFVVERGRSVSIPDRGTVTFDLVWSGCLYAVVGAEPLGFQLIPEERPLLAAFASSLVAALNPVLDFTHPRLGPVGPLAFVHFAGPIEPAGPDLLRTRGVTYVHPGVICRCPTGTGTAARLAIMASDGDIREGQRLQTVSLDGSTFLAAMVAPARVGPYDGVRTALTGRAWTLARSDLVVDLADPMIHDDGLTPLLTGLQPFKPLRPRRAHARRS